MDNGYYFSEKYEFELKNRNGHICLFNILKPSGLGYSYKYCQCGKRKK
jgi:hypothetical protein